jgi:hypothetical protein
MIQSVYVCVCFMLGGPELGLFQMCRGGSYDGEL